MKLNISPGKYVVAVSGGVDSMALLDLLVKQAIVNSQQSTVDSRKNAKTNDQRLSTNDSTSSIELVVAHFDHGIRGDSKLDEQLVRKTAKKYKLTYETEAGKLGKTASEAKAREARYKFIEAVKDKHKAKSIITAHHQDDLIETAIINMIRGTGPRGLSSIKNNSDVIRPLLSTGKNEIIDYAKKHKLVWREDETNRSDIFLRNYIRKNIASKLSLADKRLFIHNLDKVAETNRTLSKETATLSQEIIKGNQLIRQKFIMLPPEVASYLLMHWFRSHGYSSYNQNIIKRVCLSIKTAVPKTTLLLNGHIKLFFEQSHVTLIKD